jgi:hypothetical protein
MSFTIRATLTADATRRTTVAAGAFADPSAKNDRREPMDMSASETSAQALQASPSPARSPSISIARTASSEIHSSYATPPTRPPAPTSSNASAPSITPTSLATVPWPRQPKPSPSA